MKKLFHITFIILQCHNYNTFVNKLLNKLYFRLNWNLIIKKPLVHNFIWNFSLEFVLNNAKNDVIPNPFQELLISLSNFAKKGPKCNNLLFPNASILKAFS